MQGNTVRNYYVSEGVKALFSIYFKDQTEENFIKALNEFNKENQINSQEIKDEALRQIKEELSKLATIDLLNARIDTVDAKIDRTEASLNAKIDKVEASLNAKIDSFKTEVKTYAIIIIALMFILQPTIFDLIKSIFK
ncbi:BdrR [Campylobacter jejuni subsp. doylei 269.97]|uniref:BdrR n=1 Tax=Campylobacter jejuni subsp. doylei (strain ATCC BAA-1458 / RM4099 / 269.97) TaxID=360109 RepID=A7H3B1_CAMJD|nr:BdrR [Campylobacter jejuni subsp. doylei 269.97]